MSTNIATLRGTKFSPINMSNIEQEIKVTRFWGGKERGVSIQLTIESTYICLDNETTKDLITKLIQALAMEI